MDRNKQPLKRGPKVKTLPLPGDFIVLGSKVPKSAADPPSDISRGSAAHKTHSTSSGTNGDRKRDSPGSASPSSSVAKKPKLTLVLSTSAGREETKRDRDVLRADSWDAVAIEVEPSNLVSHVLTAESNFDDDKIERLLCGAVRSLRGNRAKPESALYLSLMLLAKTRPSRFTTDLITEAFSSLLKRDVTLSFKSKGNSLVAVLSANILLASYQEVRSWPESFVKMYLEDALAERVWVDHCDCKGFVDNVLTAFNTKLPPKGFLVPELAFKADIASSPPTIDLDDDTSESFHSNESKEVMDVAVHPRYQDQESIHKYVEDVIRDVITRRQPMDNVSRNILRVLASTCGISEIRLLVAQRLEMWIQNPKLTRPAQELLLSVCINCSQHHQQDIEVISHLMKIRLKTKPIINHYLQCVRELLNQHPDNPGTILKHVIYNELSTSRNPNNMALISVVFQQSQDQASKLLAEIFLDVLNNRDDYLRAVRGLYREIVRMLRYDFNFSSFCLSLMEEHNEMQFKDLDQSMRDRMLLSITDLITMSVFLSISPAVREAASAYARGDKRDIGVLINFQKQVSDIERDAVWWLHTIVLKIFKPGKTEFVHCLHKALFLEQPEQYYNKDNWPVESERMMMLRLASEVPVIEDTLMRILILGLSKDHPLSPTECLDLADQLVRKVATFRIEEFQSIEIKRMELFDAVFNLCAYHHPENITLPAGYQPPALAIATLYWKSWIMLLILMANNPSTLGCVAWENYPTLRCFMEMCITNHFGFPPLTMGDKAEEMKVKELQICQLEKQEIMQFENHLASASMNVVITESNSLLLSQLTTMDPRGPCRRPPSQVIEQLKSTNQLLKLGHRLCRTRNPDFLLDIIQRQGTSQSMPWLADLVESSDGSFDMLPVQCLCEFLLSEGPDQLLAYSSDNRDDCTKEETKAEKAERAKRKEKEHKQQQLLSHLQDLLHSNSPDPQATQEILDYFLRRLSSQQSTARQQAAKGLTLLLIPPNKMDEDDEDDVVPDDGELGNVNAWLLKHMPSLSHFDAVRYQTGLALRQACLVECDPITIAGYIQFLSEYAPVEHLQDLADLALDIAQMIIERTTIINYLLPTGNEGTSDSSVMQSFMSVFVKYLRKAREPSKEGYSWSEAQDHILIQWSSGEAATMHIFVVQAMIVLLTYGPPSDSVTFEELLEIWFPSHGTPPQAFLVDTSEEALLFPDWLKLRMIRSSVESLVDAALKDLDPAQLVLFIQSFGLPIQSVSKLLMALDSAVEYNSFLVEQAVVDKGYMSKFIEVQRQRGASHGERFAAFLGIKDEPASDEDPGLKSEVDIMVQRSSPAIPQPSKLALPALHERDVISKLMLLFSSESPAVVASNGECRSILRSLQKHLVNEARIATLDKPFTRLVISFFSNVLDPTNGPNLVHRLVSLHVYSCPLFRLLLSSCCKSGIITNPFASMLQDICARIMAVVNPGVKSPLVNMIRQNQQISKNVSAYQMDRKKILSVGGDVATTDRESAIIKEIQDTIHSCPSRVEQVLQALVRREMDQDNSRDVIAALTKLLISEVPQSTSGSVVVNTLLVDWLELVEPEVITSVPELQQQLLFQQQRQQCPEASSQDSRSAIYKTCRPYLLATLTHQANWKTLRNCISLLLGPDSIQDGCNTKYAPTVVLDFLWACISIPKIWKGRDKHLPKHYIEENVLGLSAVQITQVASYILAEAWDLGGWKEPHATRNTEDGGHPILMRLPLLLHCCNYEPGALKCLVSHLVHLIETNHALSSLAQDLLLHTYLQIPQLIVHMENVHSFFENAKSTLGIPSRLDNMSHTLLIALANTDCLRDWNEKKQDVDLACRKLASTHPLLLLRQLPMIATSLRGRVQFEFPVFRSRHHLAFFTCVVGLMELLQPYLFKLEYGPALENVCESYFSLIRTHGYENKDLAGLITRFLNILLEFMTHDTQRAIRYIQKHNDTLRELSDIYPDHPSLRSITSAIAMPRHMPAATLEGAADREQPPPVLLSFAPPPQPPAWTPAQLTPIVVRLANLDNVEEVMIALHDLDSISSRKVTVLEYVSDELKKLLVHPSESCRNLSHNLLMRFLKQKPSLAKQFLDSYLACFESGQYDIIMSALDRLAEFVLLCQEHGSLLLQRVFHLNMTTNISTLPHIGEIIVLLNMQSGS